MTAGPALRSSAERPAFARSKFAIPELSDIVVPRASLVARLDSAGAGQLTLVVGSPGSGKTSLLAQWAHAQPGDALCWLNCDQADLDPTHFWRAVIGSVSRVRPGFGAQCLDLLALNNEVDHGLLECLLRASESLQHPVTLVVDDFQLVGHAVHEQLRFLLSRGFGQVRVVLGSRSEPDVGLDRLRLAGGLCEVREAQLRMSAAEAAALIANLGPAAAPGELDVLMERTEGWAAGLQLAAIALRDVAERGDFVARLDGSHEVIGHYLWAEVFRAQPAEVRRFLLDTCVVDELSHGLAAALSPGTPVTLLDIEAANLLVVRLDAAGRSFRYHHLFADMLRFRLHATDGEHERTLHERAADWYREHGDSRAAFRHQWRAGRRTAAIATIHGTVLESYHDDLLPSFEEADRSLTDDDLLAAPGPAISYSIALMTSGFSEEANRLATRIDLLARSALGPEELEQLQSIRCLTALTLGDTRGSIRHGRALLAIAARAAGEGPDGDVGPAGGADTGAAGTAETGEVAGAAEAGAGARALRRRRELGRDDDWIALGITGTARSLVWQDDYRAVRELLTAWTPDPLLRTAQIEHAATLGFCRLMAGDLTAGVALAQEVVDQLTSPGVAADLGLHPAALLGTALLERGELAAAEPILRGVSDADSMLRLPIRVLAKIGLSRIWRMEDNYDAAFAVLDGALQLLPSRPPGSGIVGHLRARQASLLIDTGDHEAAAPLTEGMSAGFLRSLLQVRRAIAAADTDRARRHLPQLAALAQSRRQRLDTELARLALCAALGEPLDAAAEAVLELAAPQGFVLPIAEAGSVALDAVRQVARVRPATGYVSALMAARPGAPMSGRAHSQGSFRPAEQAGARGAALPGDVADLRGDCR